GGGGAASASDGGGEQIRRPALRRRAVDEDEDVLVRLVHQLELLHVLDVTARAVATFRKRLMLDAWASRYGRSRPLPAGLLRTQSGEIPTDSRSSACTARP